MKIARENIENKTLDKTLSLTANMGCENLYPVEIQRLFERLGLE